MMLSRMLFSNHQKAWKITAVAISVIIVGFCLGEREGWPFLGPTIQKHLSHLLNRQISFEDNAAGRYPQSKGSNNPSSQLKSFQITFLGGLTLKSAKLHIAAPEWSTKPHFIDASNTRLKLRYADIWRAYRGHAIRIRSLQATDLDGYIERMADGRASWQFGRQPSSPNKALDLPSFDELLLSNGLLHIDDVPLKSKIEARLSLTNNTGNQTTILKNNELNKNGLNNSTSKNGKLTASAVGEYQALPFKIELISTGALPKTIGTSEKLPVAIKFNAVIGRAKLIFKGETANVMHLNSFAGSFSLEGPSLAAVGDLVGVTLPTTAAFNSDGVVEKEDLIWRARFKQMTIGGSHLNGEFTYDKSLSTPLLKGQLAGKLVITDLGPAFGANSATKVSNRILPTRPFDLASLHKMNADVMINMQYLDLKTSYLEPIKPFQAHLQLNNAVLTLKNIKALTADGRLIGDIGLDGRGSNALWDANLAWNDVRLERWVKQKRDDGLPPYISGKLNGKAILKGQGKSTAQILASLDGNVRSELYQGAVSHLGIEVAGLDVAQSLGVLFKGDDALPVQCAVVDLQAKKGVFIPRVMVLDTTDTTVWVDGSLSLAAESLNLRAMALPKDFSPLTLRAPLKITGNFANPNVSLEKKPVGLKLAASVLLALVNPLAAVIPLLDSGDTKEAKQHAAGCQNLMQKTKAMPIGNKAN